MDKPTPKYFFQPLAPDGAAVGDVWTDPEGKKMFVYRGWEEVKPLLGSDYRQSIIEYVALIAGLVFIFMLLGAVAVGIYSAGVDRGIATGVESCRAGDMVMVDPTVGRMD